jgi:cell division protein FtsB
MRFELKNLIKDKNVLRIVVFFAATNVLGYLLMQDFDAVAFFAIVGFLMSYFSKNMIVILLIALTATNFLVMSRIGRNIREGMKNDDEEPDKLKQEEDTLKQEEDTLKQEAATLKQEAATLKQEDNEDKEVQDDKPIINKKETKKANTTNTIEHLNENGDANSYVKDTKKYVEQLEALTPAIDKSMAFLEKVDLSKIDALLGKFGGIMKKVV